MKLNSANPFIKVAMGLMLLVAVQQLSAQTLIPKLNLKLTNATLPQFVAAVEEVSNYSFVYGQEVQLKGTITLNVVQMPLDSLLSLAFTNEPVTYKLRGRHIILNRKQRPANPQTTATRKHTVSGYVTDATSGETLIGAHITDPERGLGTVTNAYGFYSLTLPAGQTTLTISYLGYANHRQTIDLQADRKLNTALQTNTMLEEVIVTTDRVEAGIQATHTGAAEVPMAQIRATPTVLGEADVMKTIQLMPGVNAGLEGSAGLYVRGGNADQNLVLLDGVPLYNVDHVLGFFSVFTPEAIKKVTLFKGSFPARYGGRLSSVVDVRTNDGDMHQMHGSFTLGLLSAKMSLEGPIVKDKTSFNISIRRSYLDLVTKPFMEDDTDIGYYFYDINAKLHHRFSYKDRLYLSLYHGKDYYKIGTYERSTGSWNDEPQETVYDDKISLGWGNFMTAVRWNHVTSPRLFANTTVAYNHYSMVSKANSYARLNQQYADYKADLRSGIRDLSATIDFDYTPTPTHNVKFGGSYTFHSFKPEVSSTRITDNIQTQPTDTTYHGIDNRHIPAHEFAVYAEDNFDPTPRLRINAGLHVSAFHVQKHTYFSLQPRLSTRYRLTDALTIKGSYSRMSQYIHLLTSAPISMPSDLWVPVTNDIKPMNAHQTALGLYYTGLKGWELSAEAYYKRMNNVLEYKDATRFAGNSTAWDEKVEMGRGTASGLELMLQKTTGNTTGWVSYTWSKSERKFAADGINNGKVFPYKYDRPHCINVVINHRFNRRFDVAASWYYASGNVVTLARQMTGVIVPGDTYWTYDPISGNKLPAVVEYDYVESRNNYRLPASHRLNLGINMHAYTKRGQSTWNISVYNAYNAMNPNMVMRTAEIDDNPNEPKTVLRKFTLLPLLPSVSYTYRF